MQTKNVILAQECIIVTVHPGKFMVWYLYLNLLFKKGMFLMELLQEWYMQETKDSEEEKFHRPIGEERLFFNAVSNGDLEFVRRNCKQKSSPKPMGWASFPGIL